MTFKRKPIKSNTVNYPNLVQPKIAPAKAPNLPSNPTPTTTNRAIETPAKPLGTSGPPGQLGDTFARISQTHRFYLKEFKRPKRIIKDPSWNTTVAYMIPPDSNQGMFFNTHMSYAQWYTAIALTTMDSDDLVLYYGIITKMAMPSIWPQGPDAAILEAKSLGIRISHNGILSPGKEFFEWMINKKIRPWITDYMQNRYQTTRI